MAPGSPDVDMIKKPKLVIPFNGAVLRDLVLAETYGGERQSPCWSPEL